MMYNEHYEIALKEWFEKTEFIQEWINENKISSKYLGMHRADIMKDLLEKYLESSLETLSKGKVMTNNKEWEVPYEIDALFNALSNLEHDNYERSYSGSKNREADAGLIRAALAAPAAPLNLTDAEIERGWHATFSTSNPYCPCNLKSFTKAVRWAVAALTTQGTSDE